MFFLDARWDRGAAWILLGLLTFLAVDVMSAGSVLPLAIGAVVPPMIILAFWRDPPALAVVLRTLKGRS